MRLASNVYRFTTCYPDFENIPMAGFLLIGSDRTAMVDALIPQAIEKDLEPFLSTLARELGSVDTIVATHGHPDHVGGLAKLKAANPDLGVLCSPAELRWVESQEAMWQDLFLKYQELALDEEVHEYIVGTLGGSPTAATATVQPGDMIDLGGLEMIVIDASGHSPGHIALFEQRNGLLFTGDSVQGAGIGHVNANVALPPLYEDHDAYISSLERMLDIDPVGVLSAHHEPQFGDGAKGFLRESIATAKQIKGLVATSLGRTDSPTSLARIARELRAAMDELHAIEFRGELQFLSATEASLRSMAKEGSAIEDDDHNWNAT